MNEITENLSKPMVLGAISSITLETVDHLDGLPPDGRVNLLEEKGERPGGLAVHALEGIRSFDQDADLGLGGLTGEKDHDKVGALVRHLAARAEALVPVPGKQTNRSQVLLAPPDHKLIIRRHRPIRWEDDLNGYRRRQLLSLAARSRGCLLGNLPVALTEELLAFGRRVGTFMGLAAGGEQLNHLGTLNPHALFLSLGEARLATGLADAGPGAVFAALLEAAGASHVLVMTGGGSTPTHVADRTSGRRWTLDPADLNGLGHGDGRVNPLGAGDRFAGVVTFLLAKRRPTVSGESVLKAAHFAREVALAHVLGTAMLRRQLRERYLQIRPLFEPDTHEPERFADAA